MPDTERMLIRTMVFIGRVAYAGKQEVQNGIYDRGDLHLGKEIMASG